MTRCHGDNQGFIRGQILTCSSNKLRDTRSASFSSYRDSLPDLVHARTLVARVHSLALVIAAVAKVSCKHGLWLVARVNQKAGMPHDTPYLEYSTISLLFCHEYFSLFPAIFVFYHTGFFVFIEKDQFAFSPPVCYTVFIYFRNYFFIHRKAYNL